MNDATQRINEHAVQLGDKTEKDVLKVFQTKNIGHWPSDEGTITINLPEEKIILNITETQITSEPELSPQGKIWLIKNFFKNYYPLAVQDLETFKKAEYDENNKANPKQFYETILKRQKGYCKFLKSKNKEYAFTERIRNNIDESILFTYETLALDEIPAPELTVFAPALKPIIHKHFIKDNQVVRGEYLANGIELENFEKEDLISYFINHEPESVEPISENQLQAAFLLTKTL